MTPERLAELKKKLEPVRHIHSGPGKCSCGFDAYKIHGIMIDYHAEIMDHLRRNQTTPGKLSRAETLELIEEIERHQKRGQALAELQKVATSPNQHMPVEGFRLAMADLGVVVGTDD